MSWPEVQARAKEARDHPLRLALPIWPQVEGVYVGACVARGPGSSFRGTAHAHCALTDFFHGWICIRSRKRVGTYSLNPDETWDGSITQARDELLHEVAHLLVKPYHWHDKTFWEQFKAIGGKPSKYERERYKL